MVQSGVFSGKHLSKKMKKGPEWKSALQMAGRQT